MSKEHNHFETPQDMPEDGQLATGNAHALLANGGKLFLEMMHRITADRISHTDEQPSTPPEEEALD